MPHATVALLDRIDSLLEGPQSAEQIERTLTDGYAQALGLETERLRIERRLEDTKTHPDTEAHQLLGERLIAIDSELGKLRDRLGVLREKTLQARY